MALRISRKQAQLLRDDVVKLIRNYWDVDSVSLLSNERIHDIVIDLTEETDNQGNFTSLRIHLEPYDNKIVLPTLEDILSGKYDVDAPFHDTVPKKGVKVVSKIMDLSPVLFKFKERINSLRKKEQAKLFCSELDGGRSKKKQSACTVIAKPKYPKL